MYIFGDDVVTFIRSIKLVDKKKDEQKGSSLRHTMLCCKYNVFGCLEG